MSASIITTTIELFTVELLQTFDMPLHHKFTPLSYTQVYWN